MKSAPRVLLAGRASLFAKRGGDSVQLAATAAALQAAGVAVRIGTGPRPELTEVDVVHLFNLSRVAETTSQLEHARSRGIPCVLTTIHQDLREYHTRGRRGLGGWGARLLGAAGVEHARALGHAARDPALTGAVLRQLTLGFAGAQMRLLSGVVSVIGATRLELDALSASFGSLRDPRVIPLGVDPLFSRAAPGSFLAQHAARDFVLCVGRIEDLKNQLALLEAMDGAERDLVFIGDPNPAHRSYFREFRRRVAHRKNTWHLPARPQEQVAAAMAACRVHVLPSWVENVGLVSLEAAVAGAAVVSTERGYLREVLGEDAAYCDPSSPASIRAAMDWALERGPRPGLARELASRHTWENAARLLLPVYERAREMR